MFSIVSPQLSVSECEKQSRSFVALPEQAVTCGQLPDGTAVDEPLQLFISNAFQIFDGPQPVNGHFFHKFNSLLHDSYNKVRSGSNLIP
jgi:hypothetical protein